MNTTATMGPFLLERMTCPADLSLQAPTELLSTLEGLPFPLAQISTAKSSGSKQLACWNSSVRPPFFKVHSREGTGIIWTLLITQSNFVLTWVTYTMSAISAKPSSFSCEMKAWRRTLICKEAETASKDQSIICISVLVHVPKRIFHVLDLHVK